LVAHCRMDPTDQLKELFTMNSMRNMGGTSDSHVITLINLIPHITLISVNTLLLTTYSTGIMYKNEWHPKGTKASSLVSCLNPTDMGVDLRDGLGARKPPEFRAYARKPKS
jgi:hypothetical protein